MTTTTTRPWPTLLRLFPGPRTELAKQLNLTRQGLHYFERGQHRQCPWWLCSKYSKVLAKSGTTDGSPAPKGEELVRSWTATFGPQEMTP